MSADSVDSGSDSDCDVGGVIDIANSRAADVETKQIVKLPSLLFRPASKEQPDGCSDCKSKTQTLLKPKTCHVAGRRPK